MVGPLEKEEQLYPKPAVGLHSSNPLYESLDFTQNMGVASAGGMTMNDFSPDADLEGSSFLSDGMDSENSLSTLDGLDINSLKFESDTADDAPAAPAENAQPNSDSVGGEASSRPRFADAPPPKLNLGSASASANNAPSGNSQPNSDSVGGGASSRPRFADAPPPKLNLGSASASANDAPAENAQSSSDSVGGGAIPRFGFMALPAPVPDSESDSFPASDSGSVSASAAGSGVWVPLRKDNTLNIQGGLPTIASIEQMVGGLQLGKISKHMAFSNALDSLNEYQKIMIKNHSVPGSSFEVKFATKPEHKDTGTAFCKGDIDKAFEALGNFIINATEAVNTSRERRNRRSSNVKKLTPIFASMLVQANMQLSKLSNLENAVASYLIETDSESFSFSGILANSDATGGRGGRMATTGLQENDSTADVNPEEINEILANGGTNINEKINSITEKRRDTVMQARLELQIPKFPFGIARGISDLKKQNKLVEQVVDAYISQLRLLNLALDDVAEEKAEDGSGWDKGAERRKVHAAKAEYFQLGKLIHQAENDKTAIFMAAVGLSNGIKQDSEFLKLNALGGNTLGMASQILNEEFRDPANFARLQNSAGEDLVAGQDYTVGGGETSIAIIDKVNQRVMRAPKERGTYLTEEKQKRVKNGMYDDAADKVGRLLGFNVIAKADAANFVTKNENTGEDQNVMGGSIMAFAKGQEAADFDLLKNEENLALLPRNRNQNKKLMLNEQGRMLGDFMKMQVVDYICLHADRHTSNYLINPEAEPGESTVTGIDNDMLFGVNARKKYMGNEGSADALQSIKERGAMDYQSKLDSSFPMMTESVRDALRDLDIEELDALLTPYADRVVRMAALQRATELKKLAETTEICDLSTKEGTEAFTKVMIKNGMTNWLKATEYDKEKKDLGGLSTRDDGSSLLFSLTYGYETGRSQSARNADVYIIFYMKMMGFSSEEIKTMLLENINVKDEERLITPEELEKVKGMKDIDLPLEKYAKKYNCGMDHPYIYQKNKDIVPEEKEVAPDSPEFFEKASFDSKFLETGMVFDFNKKENLWKMRKIFMEKKLEETSDAAMKTGIISAIEECTKFIAVLEAAVMKNMAMGMAPMKGAWDGKVKNEESIGKVEGDTPVLGEEDDASAFGEEDNAFVLGEEDNAFVFGGSGAIPVFGAEDDAPIFAAASEKESKRMENGDFDSPEFLNRLPYDDNFLKSAAPFEISAKLNLWCDRLDFILYKMRQMSSAGPQRKNLEAEKDECERNCQILNDCFYKARENSPAAGFSSEAQDGIPVGNDDVKASASPQPAENSVAPSFGNFDSVTQDEDDDDDDDDEDYDSPEFLSQLSYDDKFLKSTDCDALRYKSALWRRRYGFLDEKRRQLPAGDPQRENIWAEMHESYSHSSELDGRIAQIAQWAEEYRNMIEESRKYQYR